MPLLSKIAEPQRYRKTRATGFPNEPALVSDLNTVIDQVNFLSGNVAPPKKYVAIVTQANTDAPVATVLENTLGGTVVWTRDGLGTYLATLAGAFTANKTIIPPFGYDNGGDGFIQLPIGVPYSGTYTLFRASNDAIRLQTFTSLGASSEFTTQFVGNSILVEIIVYS